MAHSWLRLHGPNFRYLLGPILLFLAACGSQQDDLKSFVRDADRTTPRRFEPLPAAKPFEPFAYEGFDLPDPFKPRRLTVAKEGGGGLAPELNRRREPLEAFPLERLKVVGTLRQKGQLFAVIEANGTLYRVTKGNFIGQNFGLITNISGTEIEVKEIVQDSAGDWAERTLALSLGDLGEPSIAPEPKRDYVVPVLFATNRKKSGINEPGRYFLDAEAEGALTLGNVLVRVPPSHQQGAVEKPGWIRIVVERASRSTLLDMLNFPKFQAEDPQRHFTFAYPVEELTAAVFRDELKSRLRGARHRAAILYVHGYANSFKDAAYRTAQLTFDLRAEGFDAVPIMFSWPSDANGVNYIAAKDRVGSASDHLRDFLEQVFGITGAGVVHIIAHSMGAQVLGEALVKLQPAGLAVRRGGRSIPKFSNIILAAPDIRATDFKKFIAPAIMSHHRVTNYASSNDAALRLSKKGNQELRAGDTEGGPIEVIGIDTIDATKVNSEILGHSYFAQSAPMRRDLRQLLELHSEPKARGLLPVRRAQWMYWQFP